MSSLRVSPIKPWAFVLHSSFAWAQSEKVEIALQVLVGASSGWWKGGSWALHFSIQDFSSRESLAGSRRFFPIQRAPQGVSMVDNWRLEDLFLLASGRQTEDRAWDVPASCHPVALVGTLDLEASLIREERGSSHHSEKRSLVQKSFLKLLQPPEPFAVCSEQTPTLRPCFSGARAGGRSLYSENQTINCFLVHQTGSFNLTASWLADKEHIHRYS